MEPSRLSEKSFEGLQYAKIRAKIAPKSAFLSVFEYQMPLFLGISLLLRQAARLSLFASRSPPRKYIHAGRHLYLHQPYCGRCPGLVHLEGAGYPTHAGSDGDYCVSRYPDYGPKAEKSCHSTTCSYSATVIGSQSFSIYGLIGDISWLSISWALRKLCKDGISDLLVAADSSFRTVMPFLMHMNDNSISG